MGRAARSLVIFSFYPMLAGLVLLLVPGPFLELAGLPDGDPWIRVLGVVSVTVGYYEFVAGRSDATAVIRATVIGRTAVAALMPLVGLLTDLPQLSAVGALDLAGAVWTARALRTDALAAGEAVAVAG